MADEPGLTRAHPAKFTDSILAEMQTILELHGVPPTGRVLDPFAGVGGIHELDFDTTGIEIEPEWAHQHPRTQVGDATKLPFGDNTFDAVCTSPAYANRMADLYDGRDGSKRHTYRIALGRLPSEGSSAGMQWGADYRRLHTKAWGEVRRVAPLLVINVSNHIRKGAVVRVMEWHLRTLIDLEFGIEEVVRVDTPRMRHGANHTLRVDAEHIIVARRSS